MRRRSPALLFLLALATACAASEAGPWMEPIGDWQIRSGETLEIVIRAEDPDGGALTFFIDGRPDGASFTQGATTATLLWTPAASQAADGGLAWPMTVSVQNEAGRFVSEPFVVTVFPGAQSPRFVGPTNCALAEGEEELAFRVEIRDEDSALVVLTMTEGPEGAVFEQDEAKRGLFTWTPSDEQRAESNVYHATFRADDGESAPREEVFVLVLVW